MLTLTAKNFDELVLRADKPVLVEFWAEWCPPCKAMVPILESLEAELGDRLTIAKLNSDDHPEIALRYNVRAIPTLNLYRAGEVVHQVVGARSKKRLRDEIEGRY